MILVKRKNELVTVEKGKSLKEGDVPVAHIMPNFSSSQSGEAPYKIHYVYWFGFNTVEGDKKIEAMMRERFGNNIVDVYIDDEGDVWDRLN